MTRKSDGARTPGGLEIVASVGGPEDAEALTPKHDEVRAVAASDEMHEFPCGHRAAKLYDLDLFGNVLTNNGKVPEKCGDCLVAELRPLVIRCARCGLAIMPGEPVALYCYSSTYRREWVTEVESGVLGCLRWDCCPSGGFFAGHWTGKSFRPAFSSGLSAAVECLESGGMVCGSPGDMPDEPGAPLQAPLPPRRPWYRRWFPWLFR